MIYDVECVRVDGQIMAYVKVQNEWTGQVRGQLRTVYPDKHGGYYCKADTHNVDVTPSYNRCVQYEENVRRWKEYYDKTNGGRFYGE